MMLEASQTYESSVTNSPPTASAFTSACGSSSPTHTPTAIRSSQFAAPKSAAEIEQVQRNRIPDNTNKTQSTALSY